MLPFGAGNFGFPASGVIKFLLENGAGVNNKSGDVTVSFVKRHVTLPRITYTYDKYGNTYAHEIRGSTAHVLSFERIEGGSPLDCATDAATRTLLVRPGGKSSNPDMAKHFQQVFGRYCGSYDPSAEIRALQP